LVVVVGVLLFLASLGTVYFATHWGGGTPLYSYSGEPTAFSVAPGHYALVASYAPSNPIHPSSSTLPTIVCSGHEADGSEINVTPRFRNLPGGLFDKIGFMGSYEYTWRVADLTITQPGPTLMCNGHWWGLSLVPAWTVRLWIAEGWVLAVLLVAAVVLLWRHSRPTASKLWSNRLLFGLVGVAVAVGLVYQLLPKALDGATVRGYPAGNLPTIPDCSMDDPQVVTGQNATGLSFDKAYLFEEAGIAICLSSPQQFTLPPGSVIPPGTPMMLALTQAYVSAPDPSADVDPNDLSGGINIDISAASGGEPVGSFPVFRSDKWVNSLTQPVGSVDATYNPSDTQLLAYSTTDTADLDLTMTLWLNNVHNWSVVADFQLASY